MLKIFESIDAPFETPFLENERITRPWEWFFRRIQDRIRPLGIERSMDLVNNITSYSFATSDVNTSTDTITETSHSYYTGLQGAFSSTGALPGGLLSSTLYYIINTGANTYKVATSCKKP